MKRPLLITGIVPGYPNTPTSLSIAQTLLDSGADILELSASFSESIADGKTLQLAHNAVLASGFTKSEAFDLYKKIKGLQALSLLPAPLFLIEYANIIYHYGIDAYYKKVAEVGINYVLIPDVPLEEAIPFVEAAQKHGIAHIFMLAPTTPDERVKKSVELAKRATTKQPLSTFLYLVSVTGVTGSRTDLRKETVDFIRRIRSLTDLPLIVGFGISKQEHIKAVTDAGADGIVTCSAIVDIVHNLRDEKDKMLRAIAGYVKNLRE